MGRFLFIIVAMAFNARLARASFVESTYIDLKSMIDSGHESAAELTGYYFLRNFRQSKKSIDVKFYLAEIYYRQSRIDEMILWLKSLEQEKTLNPDQQSKLAYLLLKAQESKGDKSAAEIQRSLLLRKFPKSEWAKKVSLK